MKRFGLMMAAVLLPSLAHGGEASDLLLRHLYAGTAAEGQASVYDEAYMFDSEACFAHGFLRMAAGFEGLAQDLYRYGATTPGTPGAAMLLGLGVMDDGVAAPANPDPEQLTYEKLRTVLTDFRADIDYARASFQCSALDPADFVVAIDVLKARIDFDGNGTAGDDETLETFLAPLLGEFFPAAPEAVPGKSKSKGTAPAVDRTIGFDVADGVWLAGYMQVIKVQLDFILAHDFEAFYDAYLHRVFPAAGLPMQDYSDGGTLFFDSESDTAIADLIAAIHRLDFPVIDQPLFQSIPEQLHAITALSRENWALIMAETDDNRELVPNPTQTSLVPGYGVTPETVAAWRETLDVVDRIIDGELLLPHWRFRQGFDLKAFFASSERTDFVLLLTGQDAVPYLRDGPIADAESFAAANRVFGGSIFDYAIWFN